MCIRDRNQWLVGLLVTLGLQNAVIAEERKAVVDLTTQQYRVESLQNEHYQLKLKQNALKDAYSKQKAQVESLEKSLANAKKTLAKNKAAVDQHAQSMQVFDKKLAAEEQKLNAIWAQTHQRK